MSDTRSTRPTYEQAIAKAGGILATGRRTAEQMSPRQLAEAAWHSGSDKTVDELEDEIRRRRGQPSRAAIQKAGEILAAGQRAADQMTARELAEAAWTPTCGVTVDELEDEIRQTRGLPKLDRGEVVDE